MTSLASGLRRIVIRMTRPPGNRRRKHFSAQSDASRAEAINLKVRYQVAHLPSDFGIDLEVSGNVDWGAPAE